MKHHQESNSDISASSNEAVARKVKKCYDAENWDLIDCTLTDEVLNTHPESGLLMLNKCVALFQLGKPNDAKRYIQQAKEQGVSHKDIVGHVFSSLNLSLIKCEFYKNRTQQAEYSPDKAYQLVEGYSSEHTITNSTPLLDSLQPSSLQQAPKVQSEKNSRGTNESIQETEQEIPSFHYSLEDYWKRSITDFSTASALAIAEELIEKLFSQKKNVEVIEALNEYLLSSAFTTSTKYYICLLAAQYSFEGGDTHIAIHFINSAANWVETAFAPTRLAQLAKEALRMGSGELAIDLYISAWEHDSTLSSDQANLIHRAYGNVRKASKQKQQHGHDLLLSYLHQQSAEKKAQTKGKLLVEIGTTREDVPGQGSTMQLAKLCHSIGMDFVTVDMDPNNGKIAQSSFQQLGYSFKAINQKGEEYLADYRGSLDYVFLDAYDFDHGKHSELRQSRYKKYLGSEIDEQQCHKMHLDCAISIVQKLNDDGVVCIDDTWQDNDNRWTAKGTTAVPYLLENGFEIIEARNRAVMLKRRPS